MKHKYSFAFSCFKFSCIVFTLRAMLADRAASSFKLPCVALIQKLALPVRNLIMF